MRYYQCPRCMKKFRDSRNEALACPFCECRVLPYHGPTPRTLSPRPLLVIRGRWVIETPDYSESDIVVCGRCDELTTPGSCVRCGGSTFDTTPQKKVVGQTSSMSLVPRNELTILRRDTKPTNLLTSKKDSVRIVDVGPAPVQREIVAPPKLLGSIVNIAINDNFVKGDSSQTQKYKPIEVKNCRLLKDARKVLVQCLQQRVLRETPVEIVYRYYTGSKAYCTNKDPIAIMTGGRFAYICDILLNWGDYGKRLLAWHPKNHDRCVFIFVQDEIFDAASSLIRQTKLSSCFPNGLFLVGWKFDFRARVRYGFGAMRRAVLTFFRSDAKGLKGYSGFWLLDDDTMIVPRTFDEAEAFAPKNGPCIIGFTRGSTKRLTLDEVNKEYDAHLINLSKHKAQLSKDTLNDVVLQQVVKYCGVRDKEFPSFHQGFINSGEDVSFQRFLQKIGKIPVRLISGSIEKIELTNHHVIMGSSALCEALSSALTELYNTQNNHRKSLAYSELQILDQIECVLNTNEKMRFGELAKLIYDRCQKHGNKMNRTPGDILLLLVELLFCWTDDLMVDIPRPNESTPVFINPKDLAMGMDIIRELVKANAIDIVELIVSFL